MSFRDLRRHTAEIDEQHRESMHTITDDLGELHFGTDPALAASRRSFLRRAATGGAIAFGATAIPVSTMIPAALAQSTTPGTGGVTSGTTPGTAIAGTSVPATPSTKKKDPPKIKGNDLTVVVFAQTIELAAVAAYQAIIATGKLSPTVTQSARIFRMHHQEHADALAAFAASEATNRANATLARELLPKIDAARSEHDLIQIAYDLEEGAAATYAFSMGVFEEWEVAAAAATIMPIESQHALAWSLVLEPDIEVWAEKIKTWIPNFQNDSGRFSSSQYAAG